jgi:hypothetical protein
VPYPLLAGPLPGRHRVPGPPVRILQVYRVSVIVFTVAFALCALAPDAGAIQTAPVQVIG